MPRPRYPYGFHTAVSIGYLTASLALLAMGSFLLIEAAVKLIADERTTIGGMTLFGQNIWAGWPMLLALIYGSVPSFFLGRAKLALAPRIHDKILFADAQMMKADRMAGTATALGVLGVGLGYWWADPVAAGLVSLDILHDGATNVANAVTDLMNERPKKTDGSWPGAAAGRTGKAPGRVGLGREGGSPPAGGRPFVLRRSLRRPARRARRGRSDREGSRSRKCRSTGACTI